jgi:hypothetical protein
VRFASSTSTSGTGVLGRLKGLDVIQFWLEEEERALAEGYNGLRITGNTSFLTPGDWPTFMEYEQALSARSTAGASSRFAATRGRGAQTSEVMHAHHCAFERPDTDWQVIAASEFSSRAG